MCRLQSRKQKSYDVWVHRFPTHINQPNRKLNLFKQLLFLSLCYLLGEK